MDTSHYASKFETLHAKCLMARHLVVLLPS